MMQVQQKWKVTVMFEGREIVLWCHDNHLRNVLHKLLDVQFTEDGMEQPVLVTIKRA